MINAMSTAANGSNKSQVSDRSPFVGRSTELAELHEFTLEVRRGQPYLVLVEGSAGFGKSTLIRHFLNDLNDLDDLNECIVVRAGANETEMLLPFGVINQLVDSAGTQATEGLPLLTTIKSADLDPLAVGAEFLVAMGNLQVDHQLVVVVVEDLHWIDMQSAQALLFAFRRMQRDRVLGIVSARTAELGRLGDGWSSMMGGGHRSGRIHLEGLSPFEVGELARSLGVSGLTDRAVARLHEHSGGSPLHCRALLEELDSGRINQMSTDLPAPRALSSIVLQRVSLLSPAAQKLAMATAVLGMQCPPALAAGVAGLSPWVSAYDELVASGLVFEDVTGSPRMMHFSHSLVQRAIYDDLGPSVRRTLHRLAAGLTAGPPSLLHRVGAAEGSDETLARDLEVAAHQAEVAHAPAQAVAWLRRAADATAASSERERLLLDALLLAINSGDFVASAGLTRELEDFDRSPRKSGLLGHQAMVSGQFALAETLLTEAWHTPDIPTQANYRASAASSMAMYLLLMGRSEEAVEWGELAAATVHDDVALTRHIQNFLSLNLVFSGRADEGMAVLGSVPEAPADVPMVLTSALVFRGIGKLFQDDLAGAYRDLSTARTRHLAGLSFNFDSHGLTFLVDVAYRAGAWDEASVHADFAVSLAHDADRLWDYGFVHAHAALVPAARGEWAVAQAHIDEAWTWADGFGVGMPLALTTTAKASMLAAQQRWADVLVAVGLLRSFGQLSTLGRPGIYNWRPFEVEAQIMLGQLDDAGRTLEEFRSAIPDSGLQSAEMDYWRLKGQLDDARGDVGEANEAFGQALLLAATVTNPFQIGQAELADGWRLIGQGRHDEAKASLETAFRRFSALKAIPYMTRCEAAMASVGAPVPTIAPNPSLGLTPTELVVARLVGNGASNRDVASELYVSVKAVEFHLSNIFDKLDIRSRRDIAARLVV